MAKGKVTDQEIFIMKGMYSDGMTIKEISDELSRAESTIEKYIDVKEPEPTPEPVAEQEEDNYTNRLILLCLSKILLVKIIMVSVL